MKNITILGSTGSIGTQALDIIKNNEEEFSVLALTCGNNIDLISSQIKQFKPKAVSVLRQEDALRLAKEYSSVEFFYGKKGINEIATIGDTDIVLNSLMGMRGLEPTLKAIDKGIDIAFANKETLVAGGEVVMKKVKEKGVRFLPVDSEHSAIFQSIQGHEKKNLKRILLTASGGPFRGYSLEELNNVTLEEALNHPNWSMGKKITVDSASMVNKGLEVIEAKWLFDVDIKNIDILVHPQSILHSAVEYKDGSIIGQMGKPDMRGPIAYAFSYPDRVDMTDSIGSLDLFSIKGGMTFYPLDKEVFKTVNLAYEACEKGGSYPVIYNGANEVLVDKFLKGKIKFIDIQNTLINVMNEHNPQYKLDLDEILEADMKVRDKINNLF